MVDRREFLGFAGAFAAVGATGAAKGLKDGLGPERLRFGALSDIHITTPRQQPYFEQALRRLDAWKVDGVLACGDLADYGLEQQLQLVADTWFKVFPGGKGGDGRPVANLMHYGDHDMAVAYVDRPDAVAQWPDAAARKAGLIFTGDRKAIWERCFHEEWQPIAFKVVKGYEFVLSHFTRGEPGNEHGNNVPGLRDFLAGHRFDPKKPFFYSQHRVLKNTAGGPEIWGQEDGQTTELFSSYPNLIAFCGHCHMSSAYEKSIWQGAFTCVQVPSLRYCTSPGGRENSYAIHDRHQYCPTLPVKAMGEMSSGSTHLGYLCMVHDNACVIRRWEFKEDCAMGPDWVIPFESFDLPAARKPFAFANRAAAEVAPEFPEGATVTVSRKKDVDALRQPHDMVVVSFPAAPAADGRLRAHDYEVSLQVRQGDVERTLLQKRVFSPRYLFGAERETEPVVCQFTEKEVPTDFPIRLVVRPVGTFGAAGRAVETGLIEITAKGIKELT